MSIHVFLGPTLAVEEAKEILDANYLPPASLGDVFHVVATTDAQVIGIVDGNFHDVPSVWHKELLWALNQGVHVVGAASMGALRAAELADFGMVGTGRIFEAYRDGVLHPYGDPFENDDEVAVIHAPAELGYRPLSDALVDIRCTLDVASREGVISATLRDQLVACGKSLYYPSRSYETILDAALDRGGPACELERLRGWLPQGRVDQKKNDALAMLAGIRDGSLYGERVQFDFHHTIMWDRLTSEALTDLQWREPELSAEDRAVLSELRLQPDRFLTLKRQAEDDLRIGPCPPVRRVILTVLAMLRSQGDYEKLSARAAVKKADLNGAKLPRAADLTGLQRLQLLDWYFSRRLACDMPDDVGVFARSLGYPDGDDFIDALLQEYAFSGSELATG